MEREKIEKPMDKDQGRLFLKTTQKVSLTSKKEGQRSTQRKEGQRSTQGREGQGSTQGKYGQEREEI